MEKNQLLLPRKQHPKVTTTITTATTAGMLQNVLANEMKKTVDYNNEVGPTDVEQSSNIRTIHEEEHSKLGTEPKGSDVAYKCGPHKVNELTIVEDKNKPQSLGRERKHELQKTERELVEKR